MISLVQLIAQRLCQGKYVETSKGLSPQLLNKETVRAFKILHSSHLPCLFGEPPGMQPRRYLAIVRIWPRISPPRRDLRVHVRVRSPGTDGSDDRGKITSLELLRRLRPGDDVGRRDHSRHGALLRALRSKTRRIRTSRRLAQKNNHAAGYA